MKAPLSVAIAAFLVFSGTANAEWSKVGSLAMPNTEDYNYTEDYYYDASTIMTVGVRKYVWHLIDYITVKTPSIGGASMKFLSSYRCGDDGTRDKYSYKDLGVVVYSGRMGGGTIVRDTTKGVDEGEVADKSVGALSPFVTAARAVSKLVCE